MNQNPKKNTQDLTVSEAAVAVLPFRALHTLLLGMPFRDCTLIQNDLKWGLFCHTARRNREEVPIRDKLLPRRNSGPSDKGPPLERGT